MNNIDFGFGDKRGIPFFSPALAMDSEGNYRCKIHPFVEYKRSVFFLTSCVALSIFAISHVGGLNSSLVFTATIGFATPVAILAGCVALGILGYKLDQMLTERALTKVAIQEFIDKSNPSHEASDWLLGDIARIKLLLQNNDFNRDTLTKKDLKGDDLLLKCGIFFGCIEIFSLLCENACPSHRPRTFIDLKKIGSYNARKCLNYMIDTKQISAEMFNDEEKCKLQEPFGELGKWDKNHLDWLQKLSDVGIDIDVGKTSIRYQISAAVFWVALDYAAHRKLSYLSSHHNNIGFVMPESNICAAVRFLQKNSKLEASRALDGYFWNERMLEVIAPCLVGNQTFLNLAFYDDNVKIGRLLWEKTDSAEVRKYSFIGKFGKKNNSKFVASLLEEGEVHADMFTKEEQSHILKQRCFFPDDKDDVTFEFLNKFVEFGFDIRAKNPEGKTLREVLSDQIASLIIQKNTKEAMRLSKGLEVVDKILKKQNIAAAVVFKQGQASDESNLSMFPDDILNYIVQAMVDTH